AKLRRMVEEHSANLTSRIDSDYPISHPVPVPGPACLAQEQPKLTEPAAAANAPAAAPHRRPPPPPPSRTSTSRSPPDTGEPETATPAACDSDAKCVSESSSANRDNFKAARPNSVEARIGTVDSNEDSAKKDQAKKTKSTPPRVEHPAGAAADSSERGAAVGDLKDVAITMTIEESASPLKDSRSSPDNRSESPKPGCSSQPDLDSSSPRSPRSSDGIRDDLSALIPTSPLHYSKSATAVRRLRLENERLQAEVTRLRRLVVSGATSVLAEKKTPTENGDPASKTHALEMELQLAKEALTSKYANHKPQNTDVFE
ncbi:hypothetical protein NQ318_015554, partial [Aromia moschata]